MATMKAALQAKKKTREILKDLAGVNGIGITWDDEGHPCVQVNVDLEIEEANRNKIPSRVEGVPVIVEPTGPIETE